MGGSDEGAIYFPRDDLNADIRIMMMKIVGLVFGGKRSCFLVKFRLFFRDGSSLKEVREMEWQG